MARRQLALGAARGGSQCREFGRLPECTSESDVIRVWVGCWIIPPAGCVFALPTRHRVFQIIGNLHSAPWGRQSWGIQLRRAPDSHHGNASDFHSMDSCEGPTR